MQLIYKTGSQEFKQQVTRLFGYMKTNKKQITDYVKSSEELEKYLNIQYSHGLKCFAHPSFLNTEQQTTNNIPVVKILVSDVVL